ncbi:MAG: restriction endonuclease subunit S [Candidatus Peribacteria bacterium]|nr:restriction endonuclease subunit S [Candidatus Peribacteria bacterium]
MFNVRDMNMKYLYYFMQTQNNHFLRMAVGSTVKSLRMDCFEKCKILIPSLPEQEKIANCLSALDNKIEKITLQFNAVQQWKRGLLQGLFV